MNNDSENRKKLLGESYGKAMAKLKKAILFELIKETNRNICFRCEEKIENIDDLSVEHKLPWRRAKNPIETFHDLNNIAFSHLKCNVAVAYLNGSRYGSRGENNVQAKLTQKQVNEIREKLKSGFSLGELSKEYKICKTHVVSIRDNKRWKLD